MPVYKYMTKSGPRYLFKICINNRQILKRGFLSRGDAREAESNYIINPLISKRISMDKLKIDYFNFEKSRLKISSYYGIVTLVDKYIFSYFKTSDIRKLSNQDFEMFYSSLAKNSRISNIHKNRILIYLKKIFSFAESFYNLRFPYILKLNKFSNEVTHERKVLSLNEFKKIYNNTGSEMYRLLFLIAFFTGCRINEVRALKVNSLVDNRLMILNQVYSRNGDGKTRIISLKTKSSKRTYEVPKFILEKLNYWIIDNKLKSDNYIFFSSDPNFPVGETTIRRYFVDACKFSGVSGVVFHSLRHSEATLLDDAGFKSKDIANYLGHSSDAITKKTYIHAHEDVKREIKDYLDVLLNDNFK